MSEWVLNEQELQSMGFESNIWGSREGSLKLYSPLLGGGEEERGGQFVPPVKIKSLSPPFGVSSHPWSGRHLSWP